MFLVNLLQQDEVLYEVKANPENWMIAGRKRGYASLSTKQGLCVTLKNIIFSITESLLNL